MSSTQQAVTPPVQRSLVVGESPGARLRRRWRDALDGLGWRHLGLLMALGLSAVLNLYRLSQNGYANVFYSAGVKSMLRSLHNFLFVSFDPGGLVSVDKPPLGLWPQVLSAKLFGFAPLSLLLPEALAGVLAVALVYRYLVGRVGPFAAVVAAFALATFPSFVAVSRANGVDTLLALLMLLACGAALRAVETGRWRSLLLAGALVGLAFNTKTLAAYLVVPGIAAAYLVCAPGSVTRRGVQLLAAGLVTLAVSVSWSAVVELTPAAQRPFVGSSKDNTEIGLTFEYNGFGRVQGQYGGPGTTRELSGAFVPVPHRKHPPRHVSKVLPNGRDRQPTPFPGPTGPLRLFGIGLGDQGGWMVPFAFFGLLAACLLALGPPFRRDDSWLAVTLVLGGWFLVEAIVLSFSKGIVHPYYASALAPGVAAMVGVGAAAFVQLARRDRWDWRLLLAICAIVGTVAAEVVILHRENYMQWFVPVLVAGTALGTALLALRRLPGLAVTLTLAVLLAAPGAYSSSTWLAPVEATFPAAGPKQAAGAGGVGVSRKTVGYYRALLRYVESHRPGTRWSVLTVAAETAAPLILLGSDAGSLAGYSGTDPVLDGPGFARLVARGEARYVVLGGEFSGRGGNRATAAVLRACRLLEPADWGGPPPFSHSLALLDCAGRERQLASS
jgi:4-amino-4-deoxy-L-arabinose transferase-like glycosyltransferase